MINRDTEIYCSFAKKAGNVGCQMMNTAFYYYGLNKIYKSFSVNNIEDAVNSVKTLDIKGFAVTMPYKTDVLKYVDSMEDSVKEVGAANTVINKDGKLHAYNTDIYSSHAYLQQFENDSKLYIIGNGGYAKAVKYSAKKLDYNVENITRENWDELFDIKNSIVYNCTPLKIADWVDTSNLFIDCLVDTPTGIILANLQASKQFELYTDLEFPL